VCRRHGQQARIQRSAAPLLRQQQQQQQLGARWPSSIDVGSN